jgi:hypothetical protein
MTEARLTSAASWCEANALRPIAEVRALALDNAILERAIEVDGSCIDGSSPICPIHDTAYCDGRGHCVELLREFLRVHPERMDKAAGIEVEG